MPMHQPSMSHIYMCIITINGTSVIEYPSLTGRRITRRRTWTICEIFSFMYLTCLIVFELQLRSTLCILVRHYYKSCCYHIESESCIFAMYSFDAEHCGQSLCTRTIVHVIVEPCSCDSACEAVLMMTNGSFITSTICFALS